LTSEPRCPVCQARFRATRECSRCGADLTPLMRLAVRAWKLREEARAHITVGAPDDAVVAAADAEALASTTQGGRLLALAQWMLRLQPSR
jgi:predicted amidophosphoribosyltransferase